MQFPGKRPVRHGDTTTHGGTVNIAAQTAQISDRHIATVGATAICPSLRHHHHR